MNYRNRHEFRVPHEFPEDDIPCPPSRVRTIRCMREDCAGGLIGLTLDENDPQYRGCCPRCGQEYGATWDDNGNGLVHVLAPGYPVAERPYQVTADQAALLACRTSKGQDTMARRGKEGTRFYTHSCEELKT